MTLSITLTQLRHLKACHDQVQLFRETFGGLAEITPANLAKAVDAGLDTEWLARETLKPQARKAYDEASAQAKRAYLEATAPAQKAYYEAIEAYGQATAPAQKAYYEAIEAYGQAIAPAHKAYCEAMAQAWADAYATQEVTP